MHGAIQVTATPPHLTYGGGPLLTAVQVYTIFWGAAWQQPAQSGLLPQLNQFFDFILTSSLLDLLAEYSVPGQAIGHGSRIGTSTITTSEPGGGSGQVTDAQIQQALQGWLANGTIPQASGNTLYFVYLPPGVTATDPQNDASCQQMCGYHWYIAGTNPQVTYAVMPFPGCGGCLGPLTQIEALTSISSHELCEAITDPQPWTGWNDSSNGEIGDICSWQTQVLDGYTVQKEWSNKANTCSAQPAVAPLAATGSALGSYAFENQNTQHVNYLGTDQHVHELWWASSGWHANDLTAVGSVLSSYAFENQNTQHVNYLGTDQHVHELSWDASGWHANDLTSAAGGAPLPATGSALSSYAFENQNTQHVNYLGTDQHIHELWWSFRGWHTNDLTSAAGGAPLPATGSALSSYAFENQNTQHVIYLGADQHVYELLWDSSAWHANDLTSAAGGATLAATGSALSSYAFENQNTRHVNYLGTDQHIYELWWDSTGWHANDLTSAAGGAPLAATGSALSSYAFEKQGTRHVIYLGADQHVYELRWDSSGWHANDLTSAAGGAPLAATGSALSSYAFENQNTQHVSYLGTDQHVHELWWASSGWHANDLSIAAG